MLFEEAQAVGAAAAKACEVQAMVVAEADVLSGKPLAGGQSWYVADGVCGFAWVNFPGNSAFGRWLKSTGKARNDYPKGVAVSISQYNQSMQRKEAHAEAMAKYLRDHGIECSARSRMD
jgi:hypothetical protein